MMLLLIGEGSLFGVPDAGESGNRRPVRLSIKPRNPYIGSTSLRNLNLGSGKSGVSRNARRNKGAAPVLSGLSRDAHETRGATTNRKPLRDTCDKSRHHIPSDEQKLENVGIPGPRHSESDGYITSVARILRSLARCYSSSSRFQ